MKTATIVKIPNKGYIVFGEIKTVSGFGIASEPYFNISDTEATVDNIVNAIRASLCNDDNKRVPNPQDWKQFNKDFLKKIGLKSLKELDNHLNKNVVITEKEMKITFIPSRPAEKPNTGFLHKGKTESIEISVTASNQEIMEAYEAVLKKCG